MYFLHSKKTIQGVSEIRVLILTSERTRQFMKLLFSKFFCVYFFVAMRILILII
jgi:hypothetical protein